MSKVVTLKGKPYDPPPSDQKVGRRQENTIKAIEQLLEDAKNGEVDLFCWVYVRPDGTTLRGWSRADFLKILGAISILEDSVKADRDKEIE
jgi:hypothetical protein